MFWKKPKINIIDTNWHPIAMNVKVDFLPRKDEYIFLNETYYEVVNVVHSCKKNSSVFVIVNCTKK
jgi:hypothetical protein